VTIAVRVPRDGWDTVTVYYVSGSTRDLVVNTERLKGLNSTAAALPETIEQEMWSPKHRSRIWSVRRGSQPRSGRPGRG
jgi:hypothetical protein